jgi:hypothetical protein
VRHAGGQEMASLASELDQVGMQELRGDMGPGRGHPIPMLFVY